MKKQDLKTLPWCPFCGQDVARPQPPSQRKLGEFNVGTCQCGAVYTCDATGHNIGAAMVEALVYACNDDWDLAWSLNAEEDYLTGRLEGYDEITHQVLEQQHLDGRYVRGVLYFIRLQREFGELARQIKARKENGPSGVGEATAPDDLPPLEPERDPKRKRRRANKQEVKQLAEAEDIDQLVDLAFDDRKTLWYLQRLLYTPDEALRWRLAHVIGRVCARLSTRQPGAVSDLLHRLFEAGVDSAATHWGLVETIGEIIAGRPDLYGPFTRHLLRHLGDPATMNQTIWALGTVAAKKPGVIRDLPFYQLFALLEAPSPLTRALAVRLLGRIQATEARPQIAACRQDLALVSFYEEGRPITTTTAALAEQALAAMP